MIVTILKSQTLIRTQQAGEGGASNDGTVGALTFNRTWEVVSTCK